MALVAPFQRPSDVLTWRALRNAGVALVGFMHYQEFPGDVDNPFENRYSRRTRFVYADMVDGWAGCARKPEELLPSRPYIDLVESDFVEVAPRMRTRNRDFAYVCLAETSGSCTVGWQAYCRNWQLARRAIVAMTSRGLTGVIVGRSSCRRRFAPHTQARLDFLDAMPRSNFLDLLSTVRILFVPNVHDASPRIIPEAILCGCALLVNVHIVGGWKYVRPSVGMFFDGDAPNASNEIALKASALAHRSRNRGIDGAFYRSEFGRRASARRLGAFLRRLGHASPREAFFHA